MGRPLLRRLLRFATVALILSVIALLLWKRWDDARLLSRYRQNPGAVAAAKVLHREETPDAEYVTMEMPGIDGEVIPFRIAYPRSLVAGKTAPCVIVNYGIGQRLRFFDYIAPIYARRGVIMIMPEQYGCGIRKKGERRHGEVLHDLRERASRLIAETRMIVDYARQDPRIDPERIDYMGISYGGIIGSILLGQEPRIRRAALVMAGGDLPEMTKSLARHYQPKSRIIWPLLAKVSAWWLSPMEPVRAIGSAETQAFLFLQVEPDEVIPLASREALYRAAPDRKREVVYPGPHDRPSEAVIRRMIEDSLDWMAAPTTNAPADRPGE